MAYASGPRGHFWVISGSPGGVAGGRRSDGRVWASNGGYKVDKSAQWVGFPGGTPVCRGRSCRRPKPARISLAERRRSSRRAHSGVPAIAGAPVRAFRKPRTQGDHSFSGHPFGLPEKNGSPRSAFGRTHPVRDCGCQTFVGLNSPHRRVTTGFLSPRVLRRVNKVRTSTPRAALRFGRAGLRRRPARGLQRPAAWRPNATRPSGLVRIAKRRACCGSSGKKGARRNA